MRIGRLSLMLASIGWVAIACATTPDPTLQPEGRRVLAQTDQIIATTEGNEPGIESTVAASKDRVWAALLEAYAGVGIEIKDLDSANAEIGNRHFIPAGRIAGKPLTTYVRCGADQLGMQSTIDQATLSVTTRVAAIDSTQTRLRTKVTGTGRRPGVSTDAVYCSSTGELEKLITRAVEARAVK